MIISSKKQITKLQNEASFELRLSTSSIKEEDKEEFVIDFTNDKLKKQLKFSDSDV